MNLTVKEIIMFNKILPIIGHPSSVTRHPTSVTRHPSPVIKHRSSVIKHPTPVIKHPSSNIGHQTSVIGHQTPVINHPSPIIGHQTSVISHPSSDISHQTSVIKHRSPIIKHPSPNIKHLSRHLSLTIILFIGFSYTSITSQSLQDYLNIAEKNNPILEYHTMTYEIGMAKVDEVGNLPDTKFKLGYYLFAPETRVGPQRVKLGVEQSFPWPGTLQKQKELARGKAAINGFDKEIEISNLRYQVKQLYYNLYGNSAKLNVLKDNKEILEIYEKMALAALENNRARMSDVFKIRVQKNELHSKIYSNINDKKAWNKQFNRLLNREEESIVAVMDSLSVLDIFLLDYKVENHPVFDKIDIRTEVKKVAKDLIQFERRPKFTAALDYISVSERQDIDVTDNGKDIFMPRVGVAVPLFNKKYDAKTKRLDLELRQIEIQKYNQIQSLKNELDAANTKLDNAILKVVAAQKNKDQIQRAINADLKAYETGKIDFDNILKMQLQKIKYEILEIEATKEAYMMKARMMMLVGR